MSGKIPAASKPLSTSSNAVKDALDTHKGKLAIGVAATLGLMVFYSWREKKLAKSDPEEYARLQKLKAVVRADEAESRHGKKTGNKDASASAPHEKNPANDR